MFGFLVSYFPVKNGHVHDDISPVYDPINRTKLSYASVDTKFEREKRASMLPFCLLPFVTQGDSFRHLIGSQLSCINKLQIVFSHLID